jgi:dihydroorotate dehydrogenase (NAD+) catalytic subunit
LGFEGLLDIASLGGICTKGLTLKPRAGNTGTRLWETPSGLLNSIGLENIGVKAFIKNELPLFRALGPVIIANLSGDSVEEYAEGARLLSDSSADMVELNISCPNVKNGGLQFGMDAAVAASVVAAVRGALDKPLAVKLSPAAPDIAAVAQACADNGADAISLVNTFPGMAIDIRRRKPVFDNISAGLSGPAIRPLALRLVWELRGKIGVPIIGIGGIDGADAAIEFLMAGASAVQIGSATFSNPETMPDTVKGIAAFMSRHGLRSIDQLALQ